MATTSPNFGLILATTSDTVSVTSHIANNFSTLDTIIGVSHTGSGELRSGLTISTPVLVNPTISGTASGASLVVASTGRFDTIIATAGTMRVSAFTMGTYTIPATIGATNEILTVVTGNAQWVAPAPGTGANDALSNLASVAINTSLNTFTAGFVTVARVIATSGSLTGLTAFQATAGTFAGALTALATVNANVVNCTGGAITAGGITVGTWALPSTIGTNGQVMRVVTGAANWYTPTTSQAISAFLIGGVATINTTAAVPLVYSTGYDPGGNIVSGTFVAPTSGVYRVLAVTAVLPQTGATRSLEYGIMISSTMAVGAISLLVGSASYPSALIDSIQFISVQVITAVASGAPIRAAFIQATSGSLNPIVTNGTLTIDRLYEF